jgi:hypothetical protein
MKLIDRIAINRLVQTLVDLIIKLAKIFSKNKPNVVDPISPPSPKRPKPLKRIVDTIDNIIPLPWRDKQ